MDSFALSPAVRVAGDLGPLGESPESDKCHCPLGGCAARHRWTPAACGTQTPRVSPDHKAPQVHREPKASKASRVGKVNGA